MFFALQIFYLLKNYVEQFLKVVKYFHLTFTRNAKCIKISFGELRCTSVFPMFIYLITLRFILKLTGTAP